MEAETIIVATTDAGEQLIQPSAEFANRFGWQNDPSKATLTPAKQPFGVRCLVIGSDVSFRQACKILLLT
jgi:hypothetical protein